MSLKREVNLSSAEMQRVGEHDLIKFRFFVGDKEYECGLFEASFLWPRVSRLLLSDCTADSLRLDVEAGENYFEQFLELGAGDLLRLTIRTLKS